MSGNEHGVTYEQLLADSRWLRQLARSLVTDENEVDDIVQHAILRILEAPPQSKMKLRSWLYSVMANFRRVAIRSERRRQAREKAQAPREHISGPDQVVLLDELKAVVSNAVLALREPYRSTIIRHYYHELSAAEIAREDGVPPNTVWVRLKRALELLRQRLDRHYGGSRDLWGLPLLLFLGGECAVAAGVPRKGGLIASLGTPRSWPLVTMAATLLVVAFIVIQWLPASSTPRDGATVATTDHLRSAALEPAAETHRDTMDTSSALPDGVQTTLSSGENASMRIAPTGVPSPRTSRDALFAVQVIDAHTGAPVAGAELSLVAETLRSRDTARGRTALDALLRSWPGSSLGLTDSDGQLFVPRLALGRDHLRIRADGYREYREPAVTRDLSGTKYTVRLQHPCEVCLRVLGPDGVPAVGLPVAVLGTLGEPILHTTDERGQVQYSWLDAETTVSVVADGYAATRAVAAAPFQELTLQAGRRVHGRVLDTSGNPIGDCWVGIRTDTWRGDGLAVTTDLSGRFETPPLPLAGIAHVRLRREGFPTRKVTQPLTPSGEWSLELPPGASLRGTVAGPRGHPLAEGQVLLIPVEGRFRARDLPRAPISSDGRFEVGPVSPGPYLLAVEHPHFADLLRPVTLQLAESPPVHCQLREGASLRGRVMGIDGTPVGGVQIRVGWICGDEVRGPLVESGSDGTFSIEGVPTEPVHRIAIPDYRWRAMRDLGPGSKASVLLEVYRPHDLLEVDGLEIPRHGILGSRNTCTVSLGADSLDLVVQCPPSHALPCFELVDEHGQTVRTLTNLVIVPDERAETGRIVVFGGTTGNPAKIHDRDALADCTIAFLSRTHAVAFTRLNGTADWPHRVLLHRRRLAPVRIELRDWDGMPLAREAILLAPILDESSTCIAFYAGSTDTDGVLVLKSIPPGEYEVHLHESEHPELSGARAFTVARNCTAVTRLGVIHVPPTGGVRFEFAATPARKDP